MTAICTRANYDAQHPDRRYECAGRRDLTHLETLKYAMIMIGTLPILCVYPFIQKYFVQGTMIGDQG